MALTALQVKNSKPGDKLSDGGGLRLDVDKNGNRSWIFRFRSPETGKERYMGFGPASDVTLAQARDAAQAARALIREGKDPIEHRNAQRAEAKVEASRAVTFRDYTERFISGREAGWKNPKHRQQWRNALRDYAHPHIGHLAVADVDTDAVLRVLRPIWTSKPETARRVRGRIEVILSAATVEGLRTGPNSALWRGHLDQVGLAHRRKSEVKHHPALPYVEMPAFWRSLVTDTSYAAQMLRFIILTAARFGEVYAMDASEIKGDVWIIPASRMKSERPHVVPLTAQALAQLPLRAVSDVTLTNCIARHTDTPATTHGMRSTFRDWAGDETDAARETAEAALAHAVGNGVEAAYRRGNALVKRRRLMEQWAAYCSSQTH
jgi:integrase